MMRGVTAGQTLAAARECLRLSVERREFGVGAVLEHIQGQLTRVRTDYASLIAEYNKALYSLIRAVGGRVLR